MWIYNYGIIFSIILIILATFVATCGLSFFVRAKNAGNTKKYVLYYSLTAAIWCFFYGLIGLSDNDKLNYFFRFCGLIGINGFLVVDYFVTTNFSGINTSIRQITRIFAAFIGVADVIVFSDPMVDDFIRIGSWTTWIANKCFQRDFHNVYFIIMFLALLINAIIWVVREKVARRKVFMWLLIAGNFGIVFSALPDTVFVSAHIPALPTSGYGAAFCAIIIWIGAVKLNAFQVTLVNAIDSIYNRINVGILVFNEDKKLALANPNACEKLGISEEDIDNISYYDLLGSTGDFSKEELLSHIAEIDKQGDSQVYIRSLNGETHFSAKTTVAMDNFNEPYCYIMALYDITDLENVMEQLKVANEAKSDFLASMSHEIRTPINAVLGLDEMIIRESAEAKIKGYATDIKTAGRSLLSIINDILDFSKIETGKMEILCESYELSTLVNDCYNMINLKAKEKGLIIKVVVDESLPSLLKGDELRIRQIIVNLLTNAVKYTNTGSITIQIAKREEEENVITNSVNLLIKVIDTGVGIEKEKIKYLFDSFTRLDETKNRNVEGTGLGLSITKQLIDLMNGKISVDSVYGEGTTFVVEIPQIIVDDAPVGEILIGKRGNDLNDSQYNRSFKAKDAKVLVVDDAPMNLVVFAGLLKQTEIQIDTAASGRECLELIKHNKYDIIFMDHMMPGMDGVEAFSHIREDKTHLNQGVPVVVLTANAMNGAREDYKDLGFDEYLSKPIDFYALEDVIKRLLPEEKYEIISVNEANEDLSEDKQKGELRRKFFFLDTDRALSYCMDDVELYISLLEIYAEDDKSNDLAEMLYDEDYKGYQVIIHSLKSNSMNLGATDLSNKARELEDACKSQDYDYVKNNHDNVMEDYRIILKQLNRALRQS